MHGDRKHTSPIAGLLIKSVKRTLQIIQEVCIGKTPCLVSPDVIKVNSVGDNRDLALGIDIDNERLIPTHIIDVIFKSKSMEILEDILRTTEPRRVVSNSPLACDLLNHIHILLDESKLLLIIHRGFRGPIPAMGCCFVATLNDLVKLARARPGQLTYASSGAGSTTLDLGAGDYRFEAYYSATTMPSTSQVDFYFVPVPAPGAMALLGVAGAIAGARRRA